MKGLALILVAVPALAWGGFIAPSSFPPLTASETMGMNDVQAAMLKQPGVARVGFYQFLVDSAGNLTKIGIAQSSGDDTDDDEAIAAIEATKFDPSPDKTKETYRLLPIRFDAHEQFYMPPAGGQ